MRQIKQKAAVRFCIAKKAAVLACGTSSVPYQLQEQGMDTYEANIALGFAADARHYTFADVLRSLEVQEIQLMTNNWQSEGIRKLRDQGSRTSTAGDACAENSNYLKTKKEKFHHYLSI